MSGLSKSQLQQIQEQLVASASTPKSMTIDGETYTGHSLAEMIAAARYAAKITPKKNGGLRFSKIVSGGPVS